jgi:hypothetical protein
VTVTRVVRNKPQPFNDALSEISRDVGKTRRTSFIYGCVDLETQGVKGPGPSNEVGASFRP